MVSKPKALASMGEAASCGDEFDMSGLSPGNSWRWLHYTCGLAQAADGAVGLNPAAGRPDGRITRKRVPGLRGNSAELWGVALVRVWRAAGLPGTGRVQRFVVLLWLQK